MDKNIELYHASKVSELNILRPKSHNAVSGKKVVFATTDPKFTLAMSHGSRNEIAVCYGIDKKTEIRQMYIDELKNNALRLLDNSASLYIVDPKSFVMDKNLKKEEYISEKEVDILEEIKINNVLTELKKGGVILVNYDEVLKSMKERGADPDNTFVIYDEKRFDKV